MMEHYGVRFEVNCSEDPLMLPKPLRAVLYHCLRELLYNVVKHAEVNHAVAHIESLDASESDLLTSGRFLRITVRDAGLGFDVAQLAQPLTRKGGFGLRHLRERLADVGGCLKISSVPGSGTTAILEVPLA